MQIKVTALFMVKSQLFLVFMLTVLALNYRQWSIPLGIEVIVFALLFEAMVLVVAFASLFSKPSEHEEVVRSVVQSTPVFIKIISWLAVSIFSGFFAYVEVAPFPSAILFLLATFAWVGSLVAMFSQRTFIATFEWVTSDNSNSVWGQINRYAACICFSFVFIMTSRMIHAPIFIRKPIGILLSLYCLITVFLSGSIFN